jgi:hypothetical protein
MEELVVDAKRMGVELDEMISSFTAHWQRLSSGGTARASSPVTETKEGKRKNS